jgi:hypothetical protein
MLTQQQRQQIRANHNRQVTTVFKVMFLIGVGVTLAVWLGFIGGAHSAEFIGAKKIPGDPYVSSGCGSSYAICRYGANWKGRYQTPEYKGTQQRLAQKCNRGTAWMDACR